MGGNIGVKIEAQYEQFKAATSALRTEFDGAMDSMKLHLSAMSAQAKLDMKGHISATEQFANIVKGHMMGVEGAVKGVRIAWAQLAVIIAAAGFMKKAVDDTVAMTVSSEKLGRDLGISATQASYLAIAIKKVHGTTEEYTTLVKGLDTQIRKHEESVKAMGLETRDANGHLKDQQTLVTDGMEVLRGYKEGTDRNIAAQVLFGKGVEVTSELLQLNKEKILESRKEADELGLTVGKDDVEATNKFRESMEYLHNVFDAMMVTIGRALMPVLNDLAAWFKSDGPGAILLLNVALDGVISIFRGLTFVVKVLWDTVTMAFNDMVTTASGFAKVFTALFRGDFSGAKAAAEEAFNGIAANAGKGFQSIMDDATETTDAITAMWSKTINGTAAQDSGVDPGGGKTTEEKPGKAGKGAKVKAAKDDYAELKAILDQQVADQQLSEGEKLQYEVNYWATVIDKAKAGSAEQKQIFTALTKAIDDLHKLRVAEAKKAAAEEAQIERIKVGEVLDAEKSKLALRKVALEQSVALGQMSKQQELAALRALETESEQADLRMLDSEIQTLTVGTAAYEAAMARRAQIVQAFALKTAELDKQQVVTLAQTQEKQAQALGGTFANTLQGMLSRTLTFKQALANIFKQIAQTFIQDESLKVARYLVGQTTMTAANVAGNATRTAADVAASKTSILASAMAAIKNIMNKAAEVFANVYNAIAGIPGVGPFLAPAMAVAASAAVIGYVGHVASAEGGYDIPAGINPITQLHQKEMVLPAAQAQVIRDMADGGGAGTGGGDTHYHNHINALDVRSFVDYLKRNPSALVDAGKHMRRNGYSTT